ncbi:MAG: DNA polymerase III subunit beta [Synechococcaceae cyanobacterium RL_1_2]|nr:DNA polymerase III subunit beta [Synechococcaceae cyanobacterium RL_1_2]
MKFISSQNDLSSNLSLISRAVPTRPTHPILGNILVVADQAAQTITLTAFDLTLGMRTTFSAQVMAEGQVTLPARLFTDIVARLPQGDITFVQEVNPEGEGVEIVATLIAKSSKFQVRGLGAEEFPELPAITDGQEVSLPINALNDGLKGVLFAASNDETKQILTGVNVSHRQDELTFASTDGHRLAVVSTSPAMEEQDVPPPGIADFEVTIPARALRELEKMIAIANNETVGLELDENQVAFVIDDQRLTSRKLDGKYPNYQALIPVDFSHKVIVERKRLLSSLELIAVLANQRDNIVKFSLDQAQGLLTLSAEDREVGNAKESIEADISGESMEIAFNIKYLLDALKALPANEITIDLNNSNKPVIFKPLAGLKMTCLVMPVQIRD